MIHIQDLNLDSNNMITDEGIKNINLHTLNLSYNNKITNEGIKKNDTNAKS
jgi:hypothetical protein